jgi:hypothetical protein
MRRRGTGRRTRQGALLGVLLLALAACGGDDDTTEDDAAADETEASYAADPDPAADDQPDASEAEGANGAVPADVTEENGMATLRPPDDATPDCDGIDELAPGASLAFPTDDAGMLDAGPGPVRVEFVGCSNTFEANLVYDAFHGEDRSPSVTGFTAGGAMGDWGAFSFEEIFWTPGEWTVVVYEDDAESGDRQEYDQVTFSID